MLATWSRHKDSALLYSTLQRKQLLLIEAIANSLTHFMFFFSCICILLSRENDQCALRARLRVASHVSTTHQGGGIPLSAFPNDTSSKLDGLFFTLFL